LKYFQSIKEDINVITGWSIVKRFKRHNSFDKPLRELLYTSFTQQYGHKTFMKIDKALYGKLYRSLFTLGVLNK
jgi:hypothetical protein